MKKTTVWLLAATALVLIGCILFTGAMTVLDWDFRKLSTVKYETNRYEISNNITDISIVSDTADVTFLPAEDGQCAVVCYEQKKVSHTVIADNGILSVSLTEGRKWYEYIGINFDSPKITVYLPAGTYGSLTIKESTGDITLPADYQFANIDIVADTGDVTVHTSAAEALRVKTSTGNIRAEGITAGVLDLTVSTGKVTVTDAVCEKDLKVRTSTGRAKLTAIRCKSLLSEGTTGDMVLKDVIATEKFDIERDTGDVTFDGCDAAAIFVETDTGHIKGTLLSNKVFITESDTGRIDVPKSVTGGRCELSTDTGNIKIDMKP